MGKRYLAIQKPLSWEWVAAFFDGEGSIAITARKGSVDMSLAITQVDRNTLECIERFLSVEGIIGVRIYRKDRNERHDIHSLTIFTNSGVEHALKRMLPYLRVKFVQAQASLSYLQDQATGNEYLSIMNEETRAGRRGGRIHLGDFRFRRSEGIKLARKAAMANARAVYQEMARSPITREHMSLSAVERNKIRGLRKRIEILNLLVTEEKTGPQTSSSIGRSRRQTNLMLKQLRDAGYLSRVRSAIAEPFRHKLTSEGRSYLESKRSLLGVDTPGLVEKIL